MRVRPAAYPKRNNEGNGRGRDGMGWGGRDGTKRSKEKARVARAQTQNPVNASACAPAPRCCSGLFARCVSSRLGARPHFVSLSQTHAHTRSSLILCSSHLIIYLQYCTVDEVKPSRFAEASSVAFAFARSVPFLSVSARCAALCKHVNVAVVCSLAGRM